MPLTLRLSCLLVAAVLSACHTPLIPKDEVTTITEAQTFALQREVSVSMEYSFGRTANWTVQPGILTAVFKNSAGVFFASSEDGVVQYVNGKRAATYDGGVWLSHAEPRLVRIYRHEGTGSYYDANGNFLRTEKNQPPREITVHLTGTPTTGQVIGAALAGPLVSHLARMDPQRILFATDPASFKQ